jgi:hypothetical protein
MDREGVLEEIDVVKRMRLVQQCVSWQLEIAPIRTKECDGSTAKPRQMFAKN